MNFLKIILLVIYLLLIVFIFHHKHNFEQSNYEQSTQEHFAPYKSDFPTRTDYAATLFFSPFWNATRYTRNMIYDLRGNPFYPNF
jgi:Ca2+/Na+ antiporter